MRKIIGLALCFGNHYYCVRMGRRQLPRNLEG